MGIKSLNNHDNLLHCEHANKICNFISIFNTILQPPLSQVLYGGEMP